MGDYEFLVNEKQEVVALWLRTREAAEDGDLCMSLVMKHYGTTPCGLSLSAQLVSKNFTWGTHRRLGGYVVMFNSPAPLPDENEAPAAPSNEPPGPAASTGAGSSGPQKRAWWQFWR